MVAHNPVGPALAGRVVFCQGNLATIRTPSRLKPVLQNCGNLWEPGLVWARLPQIKSNCSPPFNPQLLPHFFGNPLTIGIALPRIGLELAQALLQIADVPLLR